MQPTPVFVLFFCCFTYCTHTHNHNELFGTYDTNGDDYLDVEEFEVLFYQGLLDETISTTHDDHDHDDHSHTDDHTDTTDTEEYHLKCDPHYLFNEADVNNDSLLSEIEFNNFASELLNIVITEACVHDHNTLPECEITTWKHWLAGIGATILVSLIALVGVSLIPFNQEKIRKYAMLPMISFGVGALIGDAVLHLIPAVLGVHSHESTDTTSDNHDHEHSTHTIAEMVAADSFVWPCLVILLGVLLFYFTEELIHNVSGIRNYIKEHTRNSSLSDMENGEEASQQSCEDEEDHVVTTVTKKEVWKDEAAKCDCGECDNRLYSLDTDIPDKRKVPIQPFGYLNLLADAIHNFIDGIALGAAFSSTMSIGLATTIAVVCHELPQEFGDFAILMHAGKVAIALNFFSGCTAVFGCLIGLGTGEFQGDKWLLALTAGGFLYIALANMLPDVIKRGRGALNILANSGAIVLGIIVMFLILITEKQSSCMAEEH